MRGCCVPRPVPARAAEQHRGALAAVLATLLALAGHLSGGGTPPHLFGVLVTTAIAGGCGALIGTFGPSRLRVAGSVVVAQGVLHCCFLLATPVHPPAAAASVGDHAAHTPHHGGPGLGSVAAGGHDHGAMWSAHLVAALLTMVLCFCGETAFRHLTGVLSLLLERTVGVLVHHLTRWGQHHGPVTIRPWSVSAPFLATVEVFSAGIFPVVRPLRGPPAPACPSSPTGL